MIETDFIVQYSISAILPCLSIVQFIFFSSSLDGLRQLSWILVESRPQTHQSSRLAHRRSLTPIQAPASSPWNWDFNDAEIEMATGRSDERRPFPCLPSNLRSSRFLQPSSRDKLPWMPQLYLQVRSEQSHLEVVTKHLSGGSPKTSQLQPGRSEAEAHRPERRVGFFWLFHEFTAFSWYDKLI